jgi:hypothetical protein
MNRLILESGSFLRVDADDGPVTIFVRDELIIRGSLEYVGGEEGDLTIVYLGTAEATLETSFAGRLYAPSAKVNLGNGGSHSYTGLFNARQIELRNNATVWCDGATCDGGDCEPTPAPDCGDGVPNGSESDTDCGGSDCSPCPDGASCNVDSDCSSNDCSGGSCQVAAPAGTCYEEADNSCPVLACEYDAGGMNPNHECHRNGYNSVCVSQCEAIFACFEANDCTNGCWWSCGGIANMNGGVGGDAWRAAVDLLECACP